MDQIKDVLNVFLSRIIGFIIFLVLLAVVNIMAYYIPNETFRQTVLLLNSNIWIIVIFTIVLMIGEIFGALIFPFNLPAPLFNAIGAIFLIRFIFNIFEFLNTLLILRLPFNFSTWYLVISLIIFVIVIIFGYVKIFSEMFPALKKIKEKEQK